MCVMRTFSVFFLYLHTLVADQKPLIKTEFVDKFTLRSEIIRGL